MAKNKKRLSKHHIIQKCDGGSDVKDNIVHLKKNRHQALHTLFGSITLPIEKIEFLIELHKSAFDEKCYIELATVITDWKQKHKEAYNPDCFQERNVYL